MIVFDCMLGILYEKLDNLRLWVMLQSTLVFEQQLHQGLINQVLSWFDFILCEGWPISDLLFVFTGASLC
jgi:hypothetical protein